MALRPYPILQIRLMKEEEFDDVIAIIWSNFMYVRKKKVLSRYRKGLLKILVAVYPTGDIAGMLWIVISPENNWTLITGIALRDPYCAILRNRLFEGARAFILPEKTVYFNVPISLRSYFLTLPYLNCGELHLYTCHSSQISLPVCEVHNYTVEISCRKQHETFCIVKEEENVFGKGIVLYSDDHWFIRRMFAKNDVIRKLLLKHLLEEVQASKFSGIVSLYINERIYGRVDIKEFGFIKHPFEWTSYCSVEPRVQVFEDAKKGLCGLESIILETF